MEKHYRTDVRSDSDYDELPEVVAFSVDEATARGIVRLSALVTANGLYKVEKFDYRASYFRRDPEKGPSEGPEAAEVDDGDNDVRTDADCLNVSETEFWFSAYLKHTDVEILSERKRISELVEFFGIVAETGNPDDGAPVPSEVASPATAVQRPEVEAFVHQVAGLSLWSYDRDDGTPYRECEPPSDGFLDSHCCLMDLIEEARRLREGR
ncbi:hypothetical protein [Burkholderia cenocepacia]|jgi:hypothetical protein|uniref:hypothetical protein n=1 Tax=Burkholderia cenocepacia TaxID=95486 RepID=UPI0024B6ADFC|nr:hypothetical protein [Burkholderia cenocepacia]MDI9689731.1 hypothetical protein [Burkholderia cenocepacia]